MERLWPAEALRELDRRTIEDAGLPGIALMEAAGARAAELVRERFPSARRVAVLCGPGNNGGDGFVVARHLHEAGVDVVLCLAAPEERWKGDARTMLQVARHTRVPDGDLDGADLIVDALFGTGFRGTPEGEPAALIEQANDRGAPIVALDVPSGVNGSTGEVEGPAVEAALTVCFHGRKLGTAIEPGRSHSGEVVTVPIGLLGSLADQPDALHYLREDLARVPRRSPTGHKYDAGAVLVLGGAPGMGGAPAMAAVTALRSGAGIVRAVVPDSERTLVASFAPELLVAGVLHDRDEVLELCGWADAVVLGPGLAQVDESRDLVDAVVGGTETPLLLDAGALYALNGRLETLRDRPGPTALTPHAAELARLLDVPTREVVGRRLRSLRRAVDASGAAVLLKGPDSLVLGPEQPLRVVETRVPALATAGAGDVLSGVAGMILARGVEPAEALALAALAHGVAAAEAAAEHGTLVATDLDAPLGRLLA
jgi:ADP-dependent NAD(P)H-hydrate dehydratase / NAD(P)H-hydrate epimerase